MFARSAEVYDLLYSAAGKDYETEAAAVDALIRARRSEARTLLDVGCGTGRHLGHLRERYERIEGCDVAAEMVELARAGLPGVDIHLADMRTFDLARRFDAVVCLFSAIGYILDPGELRETWRRFAAHLEPGGAVVVDGWVRPSAWNDDHPPTVVVGQDETRCAVRMDHGSRDGDRTTLTLRHLVGTAAGIEEFEERHVLRLVEDAEHVAAMEAAGLRAEVVDGFEPSRGRFVGVLPG